MKRLLALAAGGTVGGYVAGLVLSFAHAFENSSGPGELLRALLLSPFLSLAIAWYTAPIGVVLAGTLGAAYALFQTVLRFGMLMDLLIAAVIATVLVVILGGVDSASIAYDGGRSTLIAGLALFVGGSAAAYVYRSVAGLERTMKFRIASSESEFRN